MAAEKVKKAVEKVIDAVVGVVDVELVDKKPGTHGIFLADRYVEFLDGVAKIDSDIAKELKELGYIK
ncbi:hypothetical protein [Paenibacillus hexagrammi]|uniref:Uncharacterized protein n=1 Tax=Paenibacillus hexagrammi TaxID=2908839 RepID=A0ABY3STF2_9BACL|nr:hypothetical protein [Paenibacillus sp. YPD9-1]UJF36534.1 hypothetical protein L0M14_30570 [Paenibacillus sp. YPD9-1]